MLPLGEKASSQAMDGTEVVVGAELDETVGFEILLLLLDNGIELLAHSVLFSKLADLSELLTKGVLLLGGIVEYGCGGLRDGLWRNRCRRVRSRGRSG